MIDPSKQSNALRAINAVLILARHLAYEGKSAEVAEVLDVAEYLPLLMLDPADRTDTFRANLADLAHRHAHFTLPLERFDAR